ncbi:MAG TPA: hypothetical protein VGH53_20565 [Streptosporangiaceae bacterium]
MRDPATGNYLRDVFCEPHDGDTWICRRDETIRLTYRDIIHRTHDGIPYLAPELVLLFMAKHGCQKDQPDFDATVPHRTPGQSAVRRPASGTASLSFLTFPSRSVPSAKSRRSRGQLSGSAARRLHVGGGPGLAVSTLAGNDPDPGYKFAVEPGG